MAAEEVIRALHHVLEHFGEGPLEQVPLEVLRQLGELVYRLDQLGARLRRAMPERRREYLREQSGFAVRERLVHAQMARLDPEPPQVPADVGDLDVAARDRVAVGGRDDRDQPELGQLADERDREAEVARDVRDRDGLRLLEWQGDGMGARDRGTQLGRDLAPVDVFELVADDRQGQEVLLLQPQDEVDSRGVRGRELAVASGRALGSHQPLILEESDLGDGEVGVGRLQVLHDIADRHVVAISGCRHGLVAHSPPPARKIIWKRPIWTASPLRRTARSTLTPFTYVPLSDPASATDTSSPAA